MSFVAQWQDVPDSTTYDNGFKIQWEHFIRHVVENEPYRWTLAEGAKGVQLVEYTQPALAAVAPHVLALAEAEDLPAHGTAVAIRTP